MHRLRPALTAAGLAVATACATRSGGSQSGDAASVVRAHIEAQNAHDVDRILATLAESVEYRMARPGAADTVFVRTGVERRRGYERALRNAPRIHLRILEQITSGPVVVTREEATGLPSGTSEVGMTLYRVEAGKIVRLWILNTEGQVPTR